MEEIKITLLSAGIGTGNFSLYSNLDSFTTPFNIGITREELLNEFKTSLMPIGTSVVRVQSHSDCTQYIDLKLPYIKIEFEDINVAVIEIENITDINDVGQWNSALNLYTNMVFNFTSLSINANTITFYGGIENIEELILDVESIISFDFLSITRVRQLDLDYNSITLFNPSNALPEGLHTLSFHSNDLATFNPTIQLPGSLRELKLSRNQIVEFNPDLPLPDSLIYLKLYRNLLTSFNPTLALPNSLIELDLYDNLMTEFNPEMPLPSGLISIDLDANLITIFEPTHPLPISLETLLLAENQLTYFNPMFITSSIRSLNLAYNAIENTNEILAHLVSLNITSSEIYLDNGTNAAPTGQGLIDLETLRNAGNTVDVNIVNPI